MVLQLAKKVFSLAPFLDSPMRCVRFEHGLQDQIVKSSWMDYGATFVCNLQCAVLDWGFAVDVLALPGSQQALARAKTSWCVLSCTSTSTSSVSFSSLDDVWLRRDGAAIWPPSDTR